MWEIKQQEIERSIEVERLLMHINSMCHWGKPDSECSDLELASREKWIKLKREQINIETSL